MVLQPNHNTSGDSTGQGSVTDDKRVELLMDHYKDSFQLTFEHWKTRNRLFILVLVTLTLMLFQLTSPNVLETLANKYVRKQVEEASTRETASRPDISQSVSSAEPSPNPGKSPVAAAKVEEKELVDFRFITSLLWFVLAYLLVQYYQRSILVDRQYLYLGGIEKKINGIVEEGFVTREGFSYQHERPNLLKRVQLLYSVVFLSLMGLVVAGKMIQESVALYHELPALESNAKLTAAIFTLADAGIAVVIAYYTVLYVQWLRRNKKTPVSIATAETGGR